MHRFFASSFCLLLVACGSSDDGPGSWGLAGKGETGGGKLLCQIDNRKVTLQSAGLQYTTLELCALNGRAARIAIDIRSQGTSRLTGVTGALDLVEAIIECEPAQPLCGTALEGYDPDPQGLGDPYGGSDEWLISDTRDLTGIQNLQLFVAAKAGTLEQYDVVEAYLTVKVYEITGSEMTPDRADSPDSATMLWSMCEIRNIHCPIGSGCVGNSRLYNMGCAPKAEIGQPCEYGDGNNFQQCTPPGMDSCGGNAPGWRFCSSNNVWNSCKEISQPDQAFIASMLGGSADAMFCLTQPPTPTQPPATGNYWGLCIDQSCAQDASCVGHVGEFDLSCVSDGGPTNVGGPCSGDGNTFRQCTPPGASCGTGWQFCYAGIEWSRECVAVAQVSKDAMAAVVGQPVQDLFSCR